jgi:hypothetical protein
MALVSLLEVRVKEHIVMPSAERSYYRYCPIVAESL